MAGTKSVNDVDGLKCQLCPRPVTLVRIAISVERGVILRTRFRGSVCDRRRIDALTKTLPCAQQMTAMAFTSKWTVGDQSTIYPAQPTSQWSTNRRIRPTLSTTFARAMLGPVQRRANPGAQSQGKCIFCSKTGLTKEHIWPVWTTVLLENSHSEKHTEQLFTAQDTQLTEIPRTRAKPGHLRTKKLRVVCGGCNSGWMSALENAVKPTLTALATSQPHALTPDDMAVLGRWVALKVMVAECDTRDLAVTPPDVRKQFMADQRVPSEFRICIGQCGVRGWECGYYRHAATVARSPLVTPQHRFKNIHSVAIGIGDLFIFAMYTTLSGLFNANPNYSDALVPVFPAQGAPTWPPPRRLSGEQAGWIAATLDRMLRGGNVKWVPGWPT